MTGDNIIMRRTSLINASFSAQLEGRQRCGCSVGNIWWRRSCCISPELVYSTGKNAVKLSAVYGGWNRQCRSQPIARTTAIARGGVAVHVCPVPCRLLIQYASIGLQLEASARSYDQLTLVGDRHCKLGDSSAHSDDSH